MADIGFSNILTVNIAGSPLKSPEDKKLVGGWVDFGAGVPGAFQLTFRDSKKDVLAKLGVEIGVPVIIAPLSDGQGTPLITAEVTALETDYDATGTFTVIRGYDRGHRMLRQRRVAAYKNKTATEIAVELARKSGVPIGETQTTKGHYEFISQANVTDWDFVQRLADENEMVMSINSKGLFQFVKRKRAATAPAPIPPGAPTGPRASGGKSGIVLKGGEEITRCRAAVTSADQVAEVAVRGWNVTTKQSLINKVPANDNPGLEIGTTPAAVSKKFGKAELVETDTPYDTLDEVRLAAESLADDVTASFAEVEVTAHGNTELRPGVAVTLQDVGKPFEGKYTVTAARHTFGDQEHYQTFMNVSGRQWRSLYGLTSGGGGSSARLPSVANALVTDIKDPKEQGRVKLKFPWLDDMYVSDWTRTVQFGGVKGGGIISPDVDDEVLVAFDRGALDHPYVIGGLYNGVDKPDPGDVPVYDATRGKVTRRTLSDRSKNRLDLLDQSVGLQRGVRLATGDDRLTIKLDRTKTEIVIDSKGKVSIRGSGAVAINAGGNLSLNAVGSLTIRSGGPMNINAASMLSVKTGGALGMTAGAAMSFTAGVSLQMTAAINIGLQAATIKSTGLLTSNLKPVLTIGGI
ncbi:VgrG-related protein [Streptomyces paludis]|uniref:Type IV secretion protein Rhs n=1 Tax=Streptomyces paludis TaxID=2282738 RepID=A0A345HLI7_9ACTN|nr:VgrG-related protein [Streptomyces paludis]AXG77561.1 type IV secretion protein Rhs [Streptomyces paludis]